MTKSYLEVLYEEFAGSSDRATAIVAAAVVDDSVRDLLETAMIGGSPSVQNMFAPGQLLGPFMARVNMAYALGLLSPREKKQLGLLAKIRNDFAHLTEELSFRTPRIASRVKELSPPREMVIPKEVPQEFDLDVAAQFRTPLADPGDPRALFEEACITLLFALKGRRLTALSRHVEEMKEYESAAEPAEEALAIAMVNLNHVREHGSIEEIEEATKQVELLLSVVTYSIIGANVPGRDWPTDRVTAGKALMNLADKVQAIRKFRTKPTH